SDMFGDMGDFDLSDMFGSAGDAENGSIDLSELLDPDKMNFHLPEMKEIDWNGILDGVDMTVPSDEVNALASRLIEGYFDYTTEHPEADYANLGQYFLDYLNTDNARKILNEHLLSILAQ